MNQTDDADSTLANDTVVELAHEFNNLLVGIVGNARLLQDELLPTKAKDLVTELLSCSERATELTAKMLSVNSDKKSNFKADPDCRVPENHSFRNTVLVIDDEEIVRSVSSAILTRAGYEVLTAASGSEGLHIFDRQRDKILCVVLDLTMPYMRGNLVFAKLKARDPDVNVFLMSGYSDSQALEEFDSEDILGFIQKPFQTEDLLRAVRSCKLDSEQVESIAGLRVANI